MEGAPELILEIAVSSVSLDVDDQLKQDLRKIWNYTPSVGAIPIDAPTRYGAWSVSPVKVYCQNQVQEYLVWRWSQVFKIY
uniref:hypothetical protein n=1 Tax=Okeania sp. SIO2F4 TaxID=2607790 RepID=UPI0025F4F51B|nr:hypothetical protein [Okeania sp. SIO2F4]